MLKENKIFKFYEQVRQEVHKIVWLSKKELLTSASIVGVAVFIFSIICLILDYSIHSIMQILLNIGK